MKSLNLAMTWVVTVVLGLFCITESVFAVPAGADLVVNGNLGQMNGDLPVGWYPVGPSGQGVEFKGMDNLMVSVTDKEILKYGPPNWAQDITTGIPVNKVVTLNVNIKSQDVQGLAAVALQCWNKGSIVGFGTTQHSYPVSGSKDWMKASFSVNVPANTDKLRILCMLAGTGKAWFDEISLRQGGSAAVMGNIHGSSAGRNLGILGGVLGSLIGVVCGVLGVLCGRNRKKYQQMMVNCLKAITALGALSLFVGVYAYLTKTFDPIYRYGLTLIGVILLFIGVLNLIVQVRYQKNIEDFKKTVDKIE